jgi:hypothetical protein
MAAFFVTLRYCVGGGTSTSSGAKRASTAGTGDTTTPGSETVDGMAPALTETGMSPVGVAQHANGSNAAQAANRFTALPGR